MRFPLLFILLGSLLPQTAARAAAIDTADQSYRIEIDKSEELLLIKHGEDVIRSYHAATGSGGNGSKRKAGDMKTPIGVYRIVDFKPDSRFHFFMQLNYPNRLDAWYGYKNELIDAHEFRSISAALSNNDIPPQDTALGGYIGIHGIGEMNEKKRRIHAQQNWTSGCIALTNKEIMELRQYVSLGTLVFIHE